MAKQKFCKGCDFFKKYDNICEYYDSNTYSDTEACSKYKNEAEEAEEKERAAKEETIVTANVPEENVEFKKPHVESELPQEKKDTHYTDEDENEDVEDEDTTEISSSDIDDEVKDDNEEEDYEEISSDGNIPPQVSQNVYQQNHKPTLKGINHNEAVPYNAPRMFSNPFSFHGRIRRMEYGLSLIIYYIYYILAVALAMAIVGNDIYYYNGEQRVQSLYMIFLIPAFWFMLAQGAKRCHDRNNSGWYQLIPFYGLWMLFADGDDHENNYGDPPKSVYHGLRLIITQDENEDDGEGYNTEDDSTTAEASSDSSSSDIINNAISSKNVSDDKNSSKVNNTIRSLWICLAVVIVLIVIAIIISMNHNSSDPSYGDADTTAADIDTTDVDSFDYGDSYPSSESNSSENNSYSSTPRSSYSSTPTTISSEDYSTDDEDYDESDDDDEYDDYDGSDDGYYDSY